MFSLGKIFGIGLIALMLLTGISASAAAGDKFLSIHARTQNNDGDGLILFYNTKDNYISQQPISKGETVKVNLTQFPDIDRIVFHSNGRHTDYDARVYGIHNFVSAPAWEDYTDYNLNVDFYKKTMYYNRVYYETGWYYKNSYPGSYALHFTSALERGFFNKNYDIIEKF
ncbi:MAG: hypothetical protein LBD03_07015 [Methanobrevibacter sp.]|jgi:hypothetical protein|nr:hypothetical protein [Candidatus Methanovirga procula]